VNDLQLYLSALFEGLSGYVYCPIRPKGTNKWIQRFFKWPQERESLEFWIQKTSEDSDVYVAPCIFKAQEATKENALGAKVCWIEYDGDKPIDLGSLPTPAMRIQTSSQTHEHIYWRIPPTVAEEVEILNRRLTYALDADVSGFDSVQVLRPPMTSNFKRSMVRQVKLLYSANDLTLFVDPSVFDGLQEMPKIPFAPPVESLPDIASAYSRVDLSVAAWNLIRTPKTEPPNRSVYLMQVGYELAKCKLTREEIIAILLHLDNTKVRKFAERHDQLDNLNRISTLALDKYGQTSTIPTFNIKEIMEMADDYHTWWGPYLPHKNSLLFLGDPGIGKTQFSLNAAFKFGLGQNFLGTPTAQAKVLFLSLEMSAMDLQYFLNMQIHDYKPSERLTLMEQVIFGAEAEYWTAVEIEKLIEFHQPNIVMIDSLSSLTDEELTEKAAKEIINWDKYLRMKYELSTWIIHHKRKVMQGSRTSNHLSDAYGSMQLVRLASTVMTMHSQKSQLRIAINKVRFGKDVPIKLNRNEHLNYTNIEAITVVDEGRATFDRSIPRTTRPIETGLGTIEIDFPGH
jgi:hypothetical protein